MNSEMDKHYLSLEPRTVSRQQFPAAPSEQCCEHILDHVPPAVSRGSLKQPAAAVAAAAHSTHFSRTIRGASLGVEDRW